jgi:hypothetical protein
MLNLQSGCNSGIYPALLANPILLVFLGSCGSNGHEPAPDPEFPVAFRNTRALATDGRYISWKEHLVDGPDVSGVPLSGSDGIQMADLDMDGYPDFISVHERDTVYDGIPRGFIRMAFGTPKPDSWVLATLKGDPQPGPQKILPLVT